MTIEKTINGYLGDETSAEHHMAILDIEADIEFGLELQKDEKRQCPECSTVFDMSLRRCPTHGCKYDHGKIAFCEKYRK
jgi:hypothetical protein